MKMSRMSKIEKIRSLRSLMDAGLGGRVKSLLIRRLENLIQQDEIGLARSYYDYLNLHGAAPLLEKRFIEHFGQCSQCGGPMFGLSTDSHDVYPSKGLIPTGPHDEVMFCSDHCAWEGGREALVDRIRLNHPEMDAEATYRSMQTALFFSEITTPQRFEQEVENWEAYG